jgi:uncharacterized protein involved in exopolysaccharide biosynthesis
MDEINLSDYLRLLKYRWRTIVFTTLAALLIAVIVLLVMPPVYEGTTTLLFPQQQQEGLGSQLAALSNIPILSGMGTFSGRDIYTEILKSRTISRSVLDRLDLRQKYHLKLKNLQDNLTLEATKEGGLTLHFQASAAWVRRQSTAGDIKLRTAQLAADVANAYIDELKAYEKSNSLFLGKKNRVFIEGQVKQAKAELAASERKLESFQERHTDLVPPDRVSEYAEQLRNMLERQIDSKVELASSEGELSKARRTWTAGAPVGISPEALVDNPVVSELQTDLARLEVSRSTLLEDFTESHPQVVSVDEKIEKTNNKLQSEMAKVIRGHASSLDPAHQELLKQIALLEIKCHGLTARESSLAKAIAKVDEQSSGLPPKEMAYARLLREVRACETVYTTLRSEHAKARIEESRDLDRFIVLDAATPEDRPVRPQKLLTLAAALMIGLVLGALIASGNLQHAKANSGVA